MPRKKWPSRSPSGAPPEIAYSPRPPRTARSLEKTSLSKILCFSRRPKDGPCGVPIARLYAIAVCAALSKILPLPSACAFARAEL